jgi:predicted nuclease with TOPRIM domain
MRWLLVLLAAAFAAAGMLVDRFSSPPVEVLVIRTDQWLFCQDYGVTIKIKALDPVTIREVKVTAKFFPEGTWNPQVQTRSFDGFSLRKGEVKQLVASFNYCPQRRVDPLILLEVQIALPNYTLSYNYFIGRVLPTTYEDLARRAASLEQRVKELTALVDQLKKQVADLQARVANLTALLAAARADNERLSAVLAQVRAERDALRAQLDQLQAQLSAVSQAKAAVEAQLADARRQLEELKASYDKLMGQYTDAQRTIADLQARLSELQRRYDELQKAEQQLRESYFSLSMKYSELSGRYDELSKAYQQVQQEKALLQSRYSELDTGFKWAVNTATALGVALLFVIALFLTRRRYAALPSPAPQTPPAAVKTAVVLQQQQGPREEVLIKWPPTAE